MFSMRCTHVYSDFALFLMRCTHVYFDFCSVLMRCKHVYIVCFVISQKIFCIEYVKLVMYTCELLYTYVRC
ncbi:hypothetical protein HanRHA438_Chr13g0578991 [Helianthus annuus]|uniref:Uncharacterized protein n=1 Tax=Helianthus annuus TaxID=4232 RepID=A0A251SRK0_HELAN|nr:hypothetical protein HanXRQr2_Chr13g0567221 [Helianthus annuus]KAJ0479260.1 hypothetical protein HanIR_Chr13g0618031 [Helianthus annuus]KAJ0856488.1 hypothetical protein HanRHA438_Chr13g0578991 [Helianthus annuus]